MRVSCVTTEPPRSANVHLFQSFKVKEITPNELAPWKFFTNYCCISSSATRRKKILKLCQPPSKLQEFEMQNGSQTSLPVFSFWFCFLENLSAASDKQGEHFLEHVLQLEQSYKERWDASVLSDYCWILQRENTTKGNRQNIWKPFISPVI